MLFMFSEILSNSLYISSALVTSVSSILSITCRFSSWMSRIWSRFAFSAWSNAFISSCVKSGFALSACISFRLSIISSCCSYCSGVLMMETSLLICSGATFAITCFVVPINTAPCPPNTPFKVAFVSSFLFFGSIIASNPNINPLSSVPSFRFLPETLPISSFTMLAIPCPSS